MMLCVPGVRVVMVKTALPFAPRVWVAKVTPPSVSETLPEAGLAGR